MVRNLTGYDPTLYKHIDKLSTKDMESSADRILSEERRTAKIGRLEDKRELERLKRH
jgi:SPT2 chromatin protein.